MIRKFQLFAVCCALMGGGMSCATSSPKGAIDELAAMQVGRFDSSLVESAFNTKQGRLIDWRERLDVPAIGQYVFYLQLNHNDNLELYRQRILILTDDPQTGALVQRAHSLKNPEKFVDAKADDARWSMLNPEDLLPPMAAGCEQVWTRTGEGFEGYVDPKRCIIISSRTGKPRKIEANTILTPTSLALAERGYDENFVQLFGSAQGEMIQLKRIVQ